jgi:hypothetical protein
VAVNELASIGITPSADNDHPGSQRCASQIIEPVKAGAVIEVRNDDQRSEVSVLQCRPCHISLNPTAQTQNIISFSVTEGLSLPEEL